MTLRILILASFFANCLSAATIPLQDEPPSARRFEASRNRIEEKFELSVQTTGRDSAFTPPPIDIFHEASPVPHPTALRLTPHRGYERMDLREEQRLRGELANYYTQTWLKHFTREWFSESSTAKNFQKLSDMMESRSVSLVYHPEDSAETSQREAKSTLLLNYGYSLIEDRGHIEIQSKFWRLGIALGQIIGGEISDVAARSYFHARISEDGPYAAAECENRTSQCRFSLSQPIREGLGASIEAISRTDNGNFWMEQAGVFLTYQGPVPFLSM